MDFWDGEKLICLRGYENDPLKQSSMRSSYVQYFPTSPLTRTKAACVAAQF